MIVLYASVYPSGMWQLRSIGVMVLWAMVACQPQTSIENHPSSLSLNDGWEFRNSDSLLWHPAEVPGDVMTDLMNIGQLSDPYRGVQERDADWVEHADWVYRKSFDLPTAWPQKEGQTTLTLEGLDTYAAVILNGDTVLQTDNMHRSWPIECNDLRKSNNELEVHFESPVRRGQARLDALPWAIPVSNEARPLGQQTSGATRKAMYQFGWDWGPRLTSCGIWKAVRLDWAPDESPRGMRLDLLELDADMASYAVTLEQAPEPLEWQLIGPSGTPIDFDIRSHGTRRWIVDIPAPEKWWPHGMGSQPLYALSATRAGVEATLRFGIRTLEWQRTNDAHGRSFQCTVNDQPVFARGANIIPPDFFPARARKQYARLIDDAIAANMNMLRVWGGAIYGEDEFYNLCDEKGLLVWQDFMFACCMVPGDSSYQTSVQYEAIEQVKRLRHRPSLALWCGNNESQKAWDTWGWQDLYNLNANDSTGLDNDYRQLFESLLPQVVSKNSAQTYWSSSPMSDPLSDAETGRSGDAHAWRVWFDTLDFSFYSEHEGRFASEYGLQSLPDRRTLTEAGVENFKDESLQFRQRSAMEWLQPGLDGWGMMRIYARRYAADPKEVTAADGNLLDRWIYLTQLTQSIGLREALERHRNSHGRYSGSLYWQLDDVWPAVSWSTVDHAGRWKLAHYAVRHANAPQRLIVNRTNDEKMLLTAFNDAAFPASGLLEIRRYRLSGVLERETSTWITTEAFSEKEVWEGSRRTWLGVANRSMVQWIWTSAEGTVLDEGFFLGAKPSEMKWVNATVRSEIQGDSVTVWSDHVAYGVRLTSEFDGHFSDNGFILLPDQPRTLAFQPSASNIQGPGTIRVEHLQAFQNP